jgi:hypothetical protein
MAETFGVTVGAIQLTTTLNLLIRLCKDAKDIAQIIEDARGDLTRLIILLERLAAHTKHNNEDSRLLALNISNCAKRAIRVRDVVDKMERLIERAPPVGKLCAVIMSIELKHLLEEMNNAEKKMDGTFTAFCYNRRISVRVHGTLEMWSLRLRNRSQVCKEGMQLDTYAIEFLSTIAWGRTGSLRGAELDGRLNNV